MISPCFETMNCLCVPASRMDNTKDRKYEHWFDLGQVRCDLKQKSIRSGFSTLGGNSVSQVLRIASIIVLARILDPEDFGVVSMVTALTVFAARFQDLGLDIATVQQEEITHEQVSSLFWMNTLVGFALMVLTASVSPAVASFYGDERLTWITIALSCSFLSSGLGVQHLALLRRRMRFSQLAWIKIISTAIGLAVGIGLALQGFRYWALVWKEVATGLLITAGAWTICHWRPSLPARGTEIGSFLRVGKDITGFNIVTFVAGSLDQVLVGKFWGAGPLGFYRQASQLMMMPISQILIPFNSIMIPALSALQKEPGKFRQYFKKVVSILSFVYMPAVMYLIIYSENIVLLVLGEKWIQSAGIFKVFAIGAFIQPVAGISSVVLITCGRTRRYFLWGVISAVGTATSLSIGIPWGPMGVAVAFAIFNYVILVPSLVFSFRDTPVSLSVFMRAISVPVLASLGMGAALLLFRTQTAIFPNILQILISLLFAAIIYCGIWYFIPGGKGKLREYLSYPSAAMGLAPVSSSSLK